MLIPVKWFLTYGVIMWLCGSVAGWGLTEIFGENYVYDMTKEEKQEFNLMSLCYAGDDFGIDALAFNNQTLESWCAERYGGIDTMYGDKIK